MAVIAHAVQMDQDNNRVRLEVPENMRVIVNGREINPANGQEIPPEVRRDIFERIQDALALPATALGAWGIYEACSMMEAMLCIDPTVTAATILGVGTALGTLYASETARNATTNALQLTGRAALATTNASKRAFIATAAFCATTSIRALASVGRATEWIAGQAPATTGAVVTSAAAYVAYQTGLASLVASFVGTDLTGTTHPEL